MNEVHSRMTADNPKSEPVVDDGADVTKMHLWVVEAIVDLPVCLKTKTNAPTAKIRISLGGEDPDGFVEMRPRNEERANNPVFWTRDEPIDYECRALVRATNGLFALMRGRELFEHLADRLTLLVGYPVRVISVGFAYNENTLMRCIAGEISEYDATTGGEEAFQTRPPKNWQMQALLHPPPLALEAIRWFRHGMMATRIADEYLFYYIALESIAKHVPGVTRGSRRSSKGEKEKGLESQENAAITYLISRHPSLPPAAKKTLATVRARIAHGNADSQTLELARANVRALQRLAADGIALVYGLDPSSFNVLEPRFIECMVPVLSVSYSPEKTPAQSWGCILSHAFATHLEEMRVSSPSTAFQ